MTDPRHRAIRTPRFDRRNDASGAWGWIAGAMFVVIVLILVFGHGPNSAGTIASNTAVPSASTTGAASNSPSGQAR
jgi:hypothetical protein